MLIASAGFSLVHKNVHFDPFLPQMTPKIGHRGDSDVPKIHKCLCFQK